MVLVDLITKRHPPFDNQIRRKMSIYIHVSEETDLAPKIKINYLDRKERQERRCLLGSN